MYGYEAGIFDLRKKCSGQSNSGITQYSSISDLTSYYGMNGSTAENVANFLSVALEDNITSETKLFIFLR
jgi:hypothetical protein